MTWHGGLIQLEKEFICQEMPGRLVLLCPTSNGVLRGEGVSFAKHAQGQCALLVRRARSMRPALQQS